ncbi:MAG: efflux RND transporter periplasmic adaptor subunit [Polyangiaceae bacterium]|jgi:membrane fusion protein, multidrug efflux system
MSTTAPTAGAAVSPSQAGAPAATRSRRPLIVSGVLLVLAGAGGSYALHARHFEDTDDAQIDGNISNVSPRAAGHVTAVYVQEDQTVKAGDVLAEIDPADLSIAVAQAKAQVAQAQAQLDAEDPSVPITLASNVSAVSTAGSDVAAADSGLAAARKDVDQLTAQLAQAQANDRTAQLERARSEKLVAEGAVSQSDFDEHNNAAAASAANVNALEQSLAGARDRVRQQQAQLGALGSRLEEVRSNAPRQVATRRASVAMRQASLDVAKAQLAQAERNLSYAKIVAPVNGIVAKKSIAVGDYVAPGQQVVAIAQTDGLWVTANYRETQLEAMRPGQPADLHVDSMGVDLHGAVDAIGGASGSRLSVLPPENASGNYVKVVQRIPVRIRLDPGQAGVDGLRIGMSVEPRVTVR